MLDLQPAWTMLDTIATSINLMHFVGSDSQALNKGSTKNGSGAAFNSDAKVLQGNGNGITVLTVRKIVGELVAKLLETLGA